MHAAPLTKTLILEPITCHLHAQTYTIKLTHDFGNLCCHVYLLSGREDWEVRQPLFQLLRDEPAFQSHRQYAPSTRPHVAAHGQLQLRAAELTLMEMLREDKDDLPAPGHGVSYLLHDGDSGDEVSGVPAESIGGGARLQGWEDALQNKLPCLVVGTDKCVVLETVICRNNKTY